MRLTKFFFLILCSCMIQLLCLGCNRIESSPYWNECRLTYGLDSEVIHLSADDQVALYDLIFHYCGKETTKEKLSHEEKLYGGDSFRIEFEKDSTIYRWNVTVNAITKFIIKNGTVVETKIFCPDYMLLNRLNEFRRQ